MPTKLQPKRKLPKLRPDNFREHRIAKGERQANYWSRIGSSQYSGSRYETGRPIPAALLMIAFVMDTAIFDEQVLKKAKPVANGKLTQLREECNETQQAFWEKFGSVQSSGSKYEQGQTLPKPLSKLIALYAAGIVTDKELARARKWLGSSSRPFQ